MGSIIPPVSIGISFYNAESTLLESIRSVFAQTYENWELILIDDGSSDKSLEIARSINDPRVRVYSDGENHRLAARLNQITKLAKYDFIARMDADDLMAPDRIEKLMDVLLTNKEYDLVSCGTFSIKNDGTFNGYRGRDESHYTFEGLLNKSQSFLHAGLIARKSWYERNSYDERLLLGQDTDLWLRSAKRNDFRAISLAQPLYLYREEGNVTVRKLLMAYKIERNKYSKLIDDKIMRYKYVMKSYVKTFLVMAMDFTNTIGYLLHRRNKKDKNNQYIKQLHTYEIAISAVLIPGIDYD